MQIWLDCDGTWIDLYGVENWLDDLRHYNPRPYRVARPLVNLSQLARLIHKAQKMGYEVGIISWLSKESNPAYDEAVTSAKLEYFAKHLPSVKFDNIYIVSYGIPKSTYGQGYLIDDEERNLKEWEEAGGIGVNANELINFFKSL